MHRYHRLGELPKKRHMALRKPDGGVYYEELKGNKGFVGPSSLLYHLHRPTAVVGTKLLREVTLAAGLVEPGSAADFFEPPTSTSLIFSNNTPQTRRCVRKQHLNISDVFEKTHQNR